MMRRNVIDVGVMGLAGGEGSFDAYPADEVDRAMRRIRDLLDRGQCVSCGRPSSRLHADGCVIGAVIEIASGP